MNRYLLIKKKQIDVSVGEIKIDTSSFLNTPKMTKAIRENCHYVMRVDYSKETPELPLT